MYAKINNTGHEHDSFKLLENKDEFFTCGVCKELGNGDRYTCIHKRCHFHVHMLCAKPPDFVDHPFYPHQQFHFCRERRAFQQCNACGGDIKGANYLCYDNGKDLHPCCAQLPPRLLDNRRGGGGATAGQQMALVLYPRLSSECFICGKVRNEGLRTWYYETCERNKLRFHVACVKKTLNQIYTKMAAGGSKGGGLSRGSLRDGHGTMAAGGSKVGSLSRGSLRDGHGTMEAGGSKVGSLSHSSQRDGHGTMVARGSKGASLSHGSPRDGHGKMAAYSPRATPNITPVYYRRRTTAPNMMPMVNYSRSTTPSMMPVVGYTKRATPNEIPVVEKKKESIWKRIGKTAMTLILTALIGQFMPIGEAAIANWITSLIDQAFTYLF